MITVKALIKDKEDAAEAAKQEAVAAEVKKFNSAKAEVDARMELVTIAEEELRIGRLELERDRAKFAEEQASFNKAKEDFAEQQAKLHAESAKPWYKRSLF